MRTVAIDFDGVIHRYSRGWQDGSIYDPPNDGTSEALDRLSRRYRLVIYTTREDHVGIWAWLRTYNLDHFIQDVSSEKPKAIAYIDDRAVAFTGWSKQVLDAVQALAQK